MTYRSEELEPPRKRRKLRPLRIIFILAIVATGAAALAYRQPLWGRFTRVLAAQDDEPIPTQKLERVSFKMETPAIGEITGLETVPVVTPSTRGGGVKVAWLIPEGTFVQAGDPVVRFDSTDAWLNLEQQRNTLEANRERTRIATGKQTTDDKVLRIDRSDAEKEYQHAVTVMPQDETIFSKWDIIEAKINATFAKERIDFLSNKGRVQKRIARADAQILAIEKNRARAEI
jgi:multidrug efflux pump subunit AcrA (membrane-fusion protein)